MKLSIKILVIFLVFCGCNNYKKKTPIDFNFTYSIDNRESLNTFDSTYRRAYFLRDTIIQVLPTSKEMYELFRVMVENSVLELPDTFITAKVHTCVIPSSTIYLSVTMNRKTKNIVYDCGCFPKSDTVKEENFQNIIKAIRSIISTKKAIRDLPKSDIILL